MMAMMVMMMTCVCGALWNVALHRETERKKREVMQFEWM